METYTILFLAVVFLIFLFVKAGKDAKAQAKRLKTLLKENFGKKSSREYEPDEYERISHLYLHDKERKTYDDLKWEIDDITWNDLNMDNLFMAMNTTQSQIGEEMLYSILRYPVTDTEKGAEILKERARVIRFFEEHEEERISFQTAFKAMGRIKKYSLADYIGFLKDVREEKNYGHNLCVIFGLFAIAMIFIMPPAGFVLILVATAVNVASYFHRKNEITPYLVCIMFIVRAMRESKELLVHDIPELKEYQQRIKNDLEKLSELNRMTWLLMSGRSLTGSIMELPMDYLRIFFHLDLIRFNEMLTVVRREEDALNDLMHVTGFLDSMIAAASFRHMLQYYSEPEFIEGAGTEFKAEELFHPLLLTPVPADISADRGVLVTGSNASGKSTFLKSSAIAVILGETIMTVPAKSCRMNRFAVLTSMSLRDDLMAGESYFMAEIRAMKRILDEVKKGEQNIFCFVDEVLRGTNTVERISAGAELLLGFSNEKTLCFAATHDIELTHMLEEYYDNYHFSETIVNDSITFDYHLLPGRAESRDAIKLLDLMGYDKEITDAAFGISEEFISTGNWPRVKKRV